jgi:hypothetical protein
LYTTKSIDHCHPPFPRVTPPPHICQQPLLISHWSLPTLIFTRTCEKIRTQKTQVATQAGMLLFTYLRFTYAGGGEASWLRTFQEYRPPVGG